MIPINNSTWIHRIVIFLLGLFAVLLSLMGIGEMVSGDLKGSFHLIPVIFVLVLGLLVWKKPSYGAIALLGVGLVTAVYFYGIMTQPEDRLEGALLMGGPFVICGLLSLIAEVLKRNKF